LRRKPSAIGICKVPGDLNNPYLADLEKAARGAYNRTMKTKDESLRVSAATGRLIACGFVLAGAIVSLLSVYMHSVQYPGASLFFPITMFSIIMGFMVFLAIPLIFLPEAVSSTDSVDRS
jgi:hypothetical protein